ncbi:probable disease resistance protein At4g27220 [Lycium barbarum]|uniref:probable disease resistance protein At4g27220 n=1 Tax=Lycium barbarum TaxID=112863 RepID=UPI00293F1407|nr:probable disease resistance protein At4g27220 [Lycium barbarum]XP_060177253.1 probable disease resistance protein At4g27220 [Lycium barbarum]
MGTEFGSAIVGAVASYLIQPIVRQFGYLFCYKKNVKDLQRQSERLNAMSNGVRRSVDLARGNLQEIAPDVEAWLVEVNQMKPKIQNIENQCLNGRCPNVKSRFVLSRRAKKTTKVVIQLQNEGNGYLSLCGPASLLGMDFFLGTGIYMEFKSRKSTEHDIMEAIKDRNASIIGICGMGGVGKTTMVKTIAKRVREEKLFDEVVMAVVSQQPDLRKIQGEISELLGLKLEEESLSARSSRLRTRLMNVKKILVILDDVWSRLDLEELGIPYGSSHEGCKIVLTSRVRDVCTATRAEKIITVEVLDEEEAWILFRGQTGNCIEAPDLRPIARDVANECKGLPIALVTVGRALQNKHKPLWEDALLQLRKALPTNIPGLLADVYRPLELSYDRIESAEARSLFLLCSLFQEDFNIPIEDLIRYGMGLRMFGGIQNLAEARNRAYTLVEILKDRFLLIEGYKASYVKMHDLVRDVAIFIASQDKHTFLISHNVNLKDWPIEDSYEHCKCISVISKEMSSLPSGLTFTKLDLLQLECDKPQISVPDSFFEGMRALKVLDICHMDMPFLPPSLGFLRNLRAMHLYSCSLEDVSVIGELVNLEILSFRGSDIKVLPAQIGKLKKLRLLDMSGCGDLREIAPNVISSLVRLEELYMGCNFGFRWAVVEEGKERSNASVGELETLSNLSTLEIQIADAKAIPRNMLLSSKLTKYAISIRDVLPNNVEKRFQRAMYLFLPTMAPLADWIRSTLRGTEYLDLVGEGSLNAVKELMPEAFQHVKVLQINNCDILEFLVNTSCIVHGTGVFPILELLNLVDLTSLQEICHGPLPAGSFSKLKELKLDLLECLKSLSIYPNVSLANLRSISINRCPRLQNLFPISVVRGLSQLEELRISDCQMMEEVFSEDVTGDEVVDDKIKFSKLKILRLVDLPMLKAFCKGIEDIEFPSLQFSRIENLPNLPNFSPESSFTAHDDQIIELQTLSVESPHRLKVETAR